ncbi:MAG: hypothetical protein KDD11_16230, partial [Acidobacteria bacterium]|nr:hypothetical protein [Acidobacteriota bacterium]
MSQRHDRSDPSPRPSPGSSAEPCAGVAKSGGESIHGRVLAQARRTPEAVAVEDFRGTLTYAGLARRSAALARRLADHGA